VRSTAALGRCTCDTFAPRRYTACVATNTLNNTANTIGWGVYCACSWTWCIGMFLPAVLLHRYGWTGFIVFAVPNVLGCAAMGYIIKTRQRSLAMVQRHKPMMIAFSALTIAYQLFFMAFIYIRLDAVDAVTFEDAILLPISFLIVGGTLAMFIRDDRLWLVLAVLIYLISLVAFAGIGQGALEQIEWTGEQSWLDIALLAPTIFFGFLLCPYLDLTFHRALQQSPNKHAFAVFGVTFAVMILFTCTYWTLRNHPIKSMPGFVFADTGFILAHFFGQIIFTVAVHIRELQRALVHQQPRERILVYASPLLVTPLLLAAATLHWTYATNEAMYLRFLVFYGLVFPAYVLTFIGPWRAKRMTKMNAARLGLAIAAFIPLYELGFIHHWTWLTVPPVMFLIVWVWGTPGRYKSTSQQVNKST